MASHGPSSSALNEPVVSQCNTALQPAMSPSCGLFSSRRAVELACPRHTRGTERVWVGCGSGSALVLSEPKFKRGVR